MSDNLPEKRVDWRGAEIVPLNKMAEEDREELADKLLRMRLDGNGSTPYARIARTTGWSPKVVRTLILEAMSKLNYQDHTELEILRAEHHARYRTMLENHWQRGLNSDEAAETVLNIMARIEGLYGITQRRIHIQADVNHTDLTENSISSILDRIEQRSRTTEPIPLDDEIIEGEIIE